MKSIRLYALILVLILFFLVSIGCNADTNDQSQPGQSSVEQTNDSNKNQEEITQTVDMKLTIAEKEQWIKYFNSVQLQFLPLFSSGETLDEKAVVLNSTFYALSQAKENKDGYKSGMAMWNKVGYKVTRIKGVYVEKAAKSLFDVQVKHQSTDFFEYENGYYWVKPVGIETTPIYRIKKATDNKDNTYSFDIYYYENLYATSGSVYHTEDGKELSKEEFAKLILDDNANIAEKPVRASKLTLKKTGDAGQYMIIENVKVTDK